MTRDDFPRWRIRCACGRTFTDQDEYNEHRMVCDVTRDEWLADEYEPFADARIARDTEVR